MKIPIQPWARRAKCRDHPSPDLWFPTTDNGGPGYSDNRAAIAICDDCPVQRDCLEYAIDHEEHGVWGGTSERERRRIRRQRARDRQNEAA